MNYQTYRKIVHMACEPAAKDDNKMEKVSFLSDEIIQFLCTMGGQYSQSDVLAALDLTTFEIARAIYVKAANRKNPFTPSP